MFQGHQLANNGYPEYRRTTVSQVLWCDVDDPETNAVPGLIGHSFPANDPDRQNFRNTRTVQVNTGNSYGRATYQEREEVTVEIDMCGHHFRKQNPFQTAKVPEIETAEAEAELSEAEMWRAKYLAEKERNGY